MDLIFNLIWNLSGAVVSGSLFLESTIYPKPPGAATYDYDYTFLLRSMIEVYLFPLFSVKSFILAFSLYPSYYPGTLELQLIFNILNLLSLFSLLIFTLSHYRYTKSIKDRQSDYNQIVINALNSELESTKSEFSKLSKSNLNLTLRLSSSESNQKYTKNDLDRVEAKLNKSNVYNRGLIDNIDKLLTVITAEGKYEAVRSIDEQIRILVNSQGSKEIEVD